MNDNAIGWVILLTVGIAFGIASITLYLWLDEIIKGYFIS